MEIILNIYNGYIFEKSRNGGSYGFEERFESEDKGKTFCLYYWTTAEFDYCNFCGRFTENCYCEEPKRFTFSEVTNYIRDFRKKYSSEEDFISCDEEFRKKRIRQVRDMLNKFENIEKIEQIAELLNI